MFRRRAAAPHAALTVWADGAIGKVHRHDLRKSHVGVPGAQPFANVVWNDATGRVTTHGARNEYGALFSLHIENATTTDVAGVSVTMTPLVGPNGAALRGTPATMSGLGTDPASQRERGRRLMFYTDRDVELFVVRYLPVRGLSMFGTGDVGKPPEIVGSRFRRRPPGNDWFSRPDHDTWYPEPCIPHELVPTFTVAAGTQQEVLVAAYVGADQPAGVYSGAAEVRVNGAVVRTIPVSHTVHALTLPDTPHLGTMLSVSSAQISGRIGGAFYAGDPGVISDTLFRAGTLLHRHKLTATLDTGGYNDTPTGVNGDAQWGPAQALLLSGNGWRTGDPVHGYRGPGAGLGTGLFVDGHWHQSAGVSQTGPYSAADQAKLQAYATRTVHAVELHAGRTPTTCVAYMYDEPPDSAIAGIQAASAAFHAVTGPGRRFKTFCTTWVWRVGALPDLDVFATSGFFNWSMDGKNPYTNHVAWMRGNGHQVWTYDGPRPEGGDWHLESPGVDPLVMMLNCGRIGVERHFFYEATYYFDFQNYGSGPYAVGRPHLAITQLWDDAQNFQGGNVRFNRSVGMSANAANPGFANTSNLDGILIWPGIDVHAHDQARDNYQAATVFPGKRLFAISRGVQLVDYWQAARAVDAPAADAVLDTVAPGGWYQHWEHFHRWGAQASNNDPFAFPGAYGFDPVTHQSPFAARWSEDPDVAEAARRRWAAIATRR